MRGIVALAIAGLVTAAAADDSRPRIAFIVSATRQTRSLSVPELRRIFLGQTTRWRDGHRIVLFVRPSGTTEEREFLEHVIRMSDIDYSQWWIGAVFRGEASGTPRVIDSTDAMIRAVAANPDAIGFIAATNEAPRDVALVVIVDR